jgi:hypothetical protein
MLKVNFSNVCRFNSVENKSFTDLIIARKNDISNLIKFLKI